jgi:putative DNA methylase
MSATNYKKKLIEVAIPLVAINKASAREKSIRHGHPSTLHLWWARRPLAACRAILFAQLVDDPSSHPERFPTKEEQDIERARLFKIIEELVVWENSNNVGVLDRARKEIRQNCEGNLPRIYDPFSGGGSIPLEAQRLGLPAYGSDLNPVPVLIGKAMIELPCQFSGREPMHPGSKNQLVYRGAEGLAEDIRFYAEKLNAKAWEKIGKFYPTVELPNEAGGAKATVMAWLWARTVPSPNPAFRGAQVPLISSFWLCRKPKKMAWVEATIDGNDIQFEVCRGTPANKEKIAAGTKAGRGANFVCLLSGDAIPSDYVKAEGKAGRMQWKLMAIVVGSKGGRQYASATKAHEELALAIEPGWRPEVPLSTHPQYMSVTNYGPKDVADLFMDRQTLALNTFTELIEDVRDEVEANAKDHKYADAIATYLGLSVSRLANRQSSNTFWDTTSEKIQQVFAMHALPMRWETAEGNPFSTFSGNFLGQVEYLAKAVANLPAYGLDSKELHLDAQAADFTGCVVSTDPPYYDNIPYADLSDFFYVWLRRSLRKYHPDLFETILVPKAEELVADHKRHLGKDKADDFFLDGMTVVMRNMATQARQDIPATIYYAFRQGEVDAQGLSSKGWATFLQAVLNAGFMITGTWPIRTELTGNLKKKKNALATSVVLVCRPRDREVDSITRVEFIRALKRELPAALQEMQKANITPVDIPQASIGPGIAIFSRYDSILESDDSAMSVTTALQLINRELDEYQTELEGEFDAETRFAITWYEQNGYEPGSFGDADGLARARGIAVNNVKHSGIVESLAGKVRLLSRTELNADWSPSNDQHLTIWECTQHLIRALQNEGELAAAVLLKEMEADAADAARDLAYRLFDISDKRAEATESAAFNALIYSWPDLTAMAAGMPGSGNNHQQLDML